MTRSPIALRTAVFALVVTAAAACHPGFQPRAFPSSGALFTASLAEYNKKNYDNAVTGFERLTLDLSARDSLLPLAHWYLAHAHAQKKEYLLAASSYARLAESFPDDSLAPNALYLAGVSYGLLWRRPDLDGTYGDLAQIQFRQLAAIYPDAAIRKSGDSASLALDEKKASKDFGTGEHYVRRHAYESSLIYFKDVVKNYPNTRMARSALIDMVGVYRRPELKYLPEAAETCVTLRTAYVGDSEVAALCPVSGAAPVPAADSAKAKAPAAVPVKKPPQGPRQR